MESGLSELARRVAKIIDPDSWAVLDKYPDAPKLRDFARQRSIAKANEILALTRAPSDAALVEALEEIESLLPTLEPIANQICPPGCLPTIGQQSKIDALVKPCAVAARALAAAKGQQP